MNTRYIELNFTVPETLQGQRLDAAIAELLPEHSRARIQQWIKQGDLLLNNKSAKAKQKIVGNEQITINAPIIENNDFIAEDIALDVIHQDDDIIVVNKPIGLVVHPAIGHYQGTLLNALLHHFPELSAIPRAGIIHRLDKDTSGILIVARTLSAHTKLVDELQQRNIKREYLALVQGKLTAGATIETDIGRAPNSRTKMAVVTNGKLARTHYRIAERLTAHTLLRVTLDTGRTHQIRVHMAHIKHPIVGDQSYSRTPLVKGINETSRTALQNFKRQALHAHTLGLTHPSTDKYCEFSAPLADDIENLLTILRENK